MKWTALFGVVACATLVFLPAAAAPPAASSYSDAGFHSDAADLSPSERAGREIWYKATAGNARFHSYVFPQRMGVLIDWWRVLRADKRGQRFRTWGLINNPGCCRPGSKGCPATSANQTYGFDWCAGDDKLLQYVGRKGYRDPACDFEEAPLAPNHPHGPSDKREDSCYLAFGTSAGVMGLRKFPNPRFDAAQWRALNVGRLDTWKGYGESAPADRNVADSRMKKLADGSVQPPFLIGMACGACHIGFDPLNPPKDPARPKWENLRGAVGNQYSRMSEVFVSGMERDSLHWQVFSHARPGTVDTSAVPTDQINNAGSINAIINLRQRPRFDDERVERWRAVSACPDNDADDRQCWCEPGRPGKCWRRALETESVFHVLKNGEDSTGDHLAVQRVYINIGSCAEQCWVNHLTDLRQLDPNQRNFGQTQVNTAQCRRDCPNFRAIEDRAGNVVDYLLSEKTNSTPLWKAKGYDSLDQWVAELDRQYGEGAVERGRAVFARRCAGCHSSQAGPPRERDFHRLSGENGLRHDWLGNDVATPASVVGTHHCRALHSNHLEGRVWGEFASHSYHARPPDDGLVDETGGGRGYYRNVSLLDLWAHAPFMHNNAIGPELCGRTEDTEDGFYRSPYVSANGERLEDAPACWPYDTSVEGRYELFLASVEQLLNPEDRMAKMTLTDMPIRRRIGPQIWDPENEHLRGIELALPAGTPVGFYGSFQHKKLLQNLILAVTDPDALRERLRERLGPEDAAQALRRLIEFARTALERPDQIIPVAREQLPLLRTLYSGCTATVENAGHRFGEDLSREDKRALTAFLATL